ncbi:MAG: hypothetical protein AAFX78_15110 [Cyanobacteria bacterium J06638_20]
MGSRWGDRQPWISNEDFGWDWSQSSIENPDPTVNTAGCRQRG